MVCREWCVGNIIKENYLYENQMGCPEYQKICFLSFLSVRKRLELVQQNGSIMHGGEANKRWFFKMGTGVRPRHLIANGHIYGN